MTYGYDIRIAYLLAACYCRSKSDIHFLIGALAKKNGKKDEISLMLDRYDTITYLNPPSMPFPNYSPSTPHLLLPHSPSHPPYLLLSPRYRLNNDTYNIDVLLVHVEMM